MTSRIAIVGPNGVDFAFLKLLIGVLKPTCDEIRRNYHLRIGRLDQLAGEQFNLELLAIEHLRQAFNMSEQDTGKSLESVELSGRVHLIKVKDLSGKNKMHGIVMFRSEESVNAVMSQRYHQIDGKEVFIHRSVPNQGALKDNKAIQYLIVSSSNSQSLVESDINNHFSQYDAEILSQEFDWDIYDIVMNSSNNDRALSTECWLKNTNDEREVDNFVQRRNGRSIRGSIIQCEKEEDEIEFCNKFQFGLCEKSSDECHWEHIPCTANGTCSSTCPYGHACGMKTVHDFLNMTSTDYRIKITGFRTEVTPQNLNQRLGSNNYYVDRHHDRIGYVVKIKTMKYAKQLMTKWHNKNIDGQLIKCQLELNPISFGHRHRSQSRAASTDGELKRKRCRSRPRDACSVQSSQETSDLGDNGNSLSITFDNREVDRDRRICRKAFDDITRTPSKTDLHHASSSESISSLVEMKCKFFCTTDVTGF
ncbi:unnamed protein product [Rotaria sp. Silwood1]|nr:unnamed protein product [Rotaria sp. Silwood1]